MNDEGPAEGFTHTGRQPTGHALLDHFGFTKPPFMSVASPYPGIPEGMEDEIEPIINKCWYTSDLILVSHELAAVDNPLINYFLENLGEDFASGVVTISLMLTGDDFLQAIANTFAIEVDVEGYEHDHSIEEIMRFFESAQLSNNEYVFVVQNVHEIGSEALELLQQMILISKRLPHLHFILWGRDLAMTLPDLNKVDAMPDISSFELPGLSRKDLKKHLQSCLHEAGYRGEFPLSQGAMERIHAEAAGDIKTAYKLVMAELERQYAASLVTNLPKAVEPDEPRQKEETRKRQGQGMLLPFRHLVAVMVLIAVLAGLFWGFGGQREEPQTSQEQQFSTPGDVGQQVGNDSTLAMPENPVVEEPAVSLTETEANAEGDFSATEDLVSPVVDTIQPEDADVTGGGALAGNTDSSQESNIGTGDSAEPEQEPEVQLSFLQEQERLLLEFSDESYFLQLFGAYSEQAARDFMASYPELGLYLYLDTYQGRDWFVVLMGDYASNEAAADARQGLPGPILSGGPFAKSMRAVRQAISAR